MDNGVPVSQRSPACAAGTAAKTEHTELAQNESPAKNKGGRPRTYGTIGKTDLLAQEVVPAGLNQNVTKAEEKVIGPKQHSVVANNDRSEADEVSASGSACNQQDNLKL